MRNEVFYSYLDKFVLEDEVFNVIYFTHLEAKVICKKEVFEVEYGLGEGIRWIIFSHFSD